jgi:hypothetical protein
VYSIRTNGDDELQDEEDPSFPGDFPPADVDIDISSFVRAELLQLDNAADVPFLMNALKSGWPMYR